MPPDAVREGRGGGRERREGKRGGWEEGSKGRGEEREGPEGRRGNVQFVCCLLCDTHQLGTPAACLTHV